MNSWPPSNLDSHLSLLSEIHSPSRSSRVKTRDFEMAPKKNKSKVEEESVAKMSEAAVQELENLGLLQAQGVIQWRAGEGEDYPMEGTLETVVFCDFVERGLALPVSEFFYALLLFWGIQLHHLTHHSILHLSIFTHFCEAFLGILPHFIIFNISLSSSPFQMPVNLPSLVGVN